MQETSSVVPNDSPVHNGVNLDQNREWLLLRLGDTPNLSLEVL